MQGCARAPQYAGDGGSQAPEGECVDLPRSHESGWEPERVALPKGQLLVSDEFRSRGTATTKTIGEAKSQR